MYRKYVYYGSIGVGVILGLTIFLPMELSNTLTIVLILATALLCLIISLLIFRFIDKTKDALINQCAPETQEAVRSIQAGKREYLTMEGMDKANVQAVLKGKVSNDNNGSMDIYYYILNDPNLEFLTIDTKSKKVKFGKPDICITELVNTRLHYNPSELVFTAVTVGGVTTGGVTDVGNYYSEKHSRSGKYFLYSYTNQDFKISDENTKKKDAFTIDALLLNSDLTLEAIKGRLHGFDRVKNMFFLSHGTMKMDARDVIATGGDLESMQVLKNDAYNKTQLTKSDCQAVKDFLDSI